jgi:hypothetical protein
LLLSDELVADRLGADLRDLEALRGAVERLPAYR